jgi:SAM-dependent methyltransferase
MTNFTKIEQFYADDAYCGFSGKFNIERYKEYVNFVNTHTSGQIFELGSGLGEAAYALWKSGVNVTATDIFPENARGWFVKHQADIEVVGLNINKIEKPDNSVENYSLYQVLEHIETPEKAIAEIYRTLKPGGKFVVVGPNLISPLTSLKSVVMGVLGKWDTPWFGRTDGYTYPFGNSIFGTIGRFFLNLFYTFSKIVFRPLRKPIYRQPCLKKPAVSDSDAVFMLNPIDMKEILINQGFEISDYQNVKAFGSFAGSTWIVAIKK